MMRLWKNFASSALGSLSCLSTWRTCRATMFLQLCWMGLFEQVILFRTPHIFENP